MLYMFILSRQIEHTAQARKSKSSVKLYRLENGSQFHLVVMGTYIL
jgi:hypothetical protein